MTHRTSRRQKAASKAASHTIGPTSRVRPTAKLQTTIDETADPFKASEAMVRRALSDREIAHWRNVHIGFVFQSFNLIPVLTAIENVELPLKLTSLKKKERMEHATTALKLVGLGDRLTHLPRQLSGGQEQRVAIARAIVTDPDLILADEPTGNLDATSATEVLTLLSRLNKEFGKTIVMVTHDPHAARFATKIRHLEKGELLEEGQIPADYVA